MIELFDDFRDILVELHSAGLASSCSVVALWRSVDTRARPRISTFWSKVEANSDNAKRAMTSCGYSGWTA